MSKHFNINLQSPDSIPTPICRIAKPSSEFYSIFSESEVLEIIHALEVKREIPLKYSYKGSAIWDNFYQKYIIPTWYRTSNVEIDLLRDNFEYLNGTRQNSQRVNVIDVGAGNSYPVKEFISKLNKLGKINKYVALDISEELLNLSRSNFTKWFPSIEFISDTIDIENSCLPEIAQNNSGVETDNIPKIILHLGVTLANHRNRVGVLKNFKDSMDRNDFLVFTTEIGSNSQWDGKARGGCKYHVDRVYGWIKDKIGISEDCELVRKYDLKTDSIVANIKFRHKYLINFNLAGVEKNVQISDGEDITIWRHHKYNIPELVQEIERAGLQLVHYSTNKYLSHIMVICKVASF